MGTRSLTNLFVEHLQRDKHRTPLTKTFLMRKYFREIEKQAFPSRDEITRRGRIENLARCLSPRAGGQHENPDTVTRCQYCDFLTQGAHVGIYEVISFLGAGTY